VVSVDDDHPARDVVGGDPVVKAPGLDGDPREQVRLRLERLSNVLDLLGADDELGKKTIVSFILDRPSEDAAERCLRERLGRIRDAL
jgi:hypothetical protein